MLIPALTGPFLAMGSYSRFSAGVQIAKKKFSADQRVSNTSARSASKKRKKRNHIFSPKSFPGIYLKSLAMGKIRSML